jgi:hypothetical protein
LFGLFPYPRLFIAEGKKHIRPDEINLVDAIGGPGYVIIQPGNAVLFEKLQNPAAVRSAGVHFISRFETIKEIVSLEEQDGEIDEVTTTTKDGIEVKVKDIRFCYRLRPGRRVGGATGRTVENPYPYSVQAVKNMVYNRSVTEEGVPTSWFGSLRFYVVNAITDYINVHSLDQLTAPGWTGEDPRGSIKQVIFSNKTRSLLKNYGAEILWCDIGHFEVPEKLVAEQRLTTWQTKWAGYADRTRTEGEAQHLIAQELGRAEGQAALLTSIARALDEIGLNGETRPHLRSIVLMRTAQILEAMTDNFGLPEGGAAPQGTNQADE